MFKWVLGLCISMYLTLLVFGGAPEEVTEVTPDTPAVEAPLVETVAVETVAVETATVTEEAPEADPVAEPVIVAETTTPEPTVAATPVTVATLTPAVPVAATPEPVAVAEATPEPTPEAVLVAAAPQAVTSPINQIWTVTGSTVNLRDLPGTNGAVIGQTRRGNSAEVIELLDNGWARVFILESGLEAYMSADFLSDQQS